MNRVSQLLVGLSLCSGLAFHSAWAQEEPTEPTLCNDGQGEMWTQTELYFGMSKPHRPYVKDKQFEDFVDEVVVPLFSGMTITDGLGVYPDENGEAVHEKSKVLILLYPASNEANANIDLIRETYVDRFDQYGVMRVDSQSCVTF